MTSGEFLSKLSPAEPLTQEEKELFAWLKLNRENFQSSIIDQTTGHEYPKYSLSEITKFALDNGFNEQMVYKHLSHLIPALNGWRIENMAAQHVYRFEVAIESLQEQKDKLAYIKELDLSDQWKDVGAYLLDGVDWQ